MELRRAYAERDITLMGLCLARRKRRINILDFTEDFFPDGIRFLLDNAVNFSSIADPRFTTFIDKAYEEKCGDIIKLMITKREILEPDIYGMIVVDAFKKIRWLLSDDSFKEMEIKTKNYHELFHFVVKEKDTALEKLFRDHLLITNILCLLILYFLIR